MEKILALFEDFTFEDEFKYPILIGKMPKEILDEIDYFVSECSKIKKHPLYFLRDHKNFGENTYQISVPPSLVENSFTFPFIVYAGQYFIHKKKGIEMKNLIRKILLRRNNSHFDGYDFWINYSYLGDNNPMHTHSGLLSGVIYVKNDSDEKTVFEDGFEFYGKRGDIILFPSDYNHGVLQKNNNTERITIAFNLEAI